MISLKSKFAWTLLLLSLALPLQAKWFGLVSSDRQEFVNARATYDSGNYQQAIEELSKYIYKTKNIKRREARAYRLLGLSYEKLGRPEKALEIYSEALEFHQKNISLLLVAADLYQRTDLLDQSIRLYDRVLEQEPDNLEALSGQAQNYLNMGFYSKAIMYYDKFLALNPDAAAAYRAQFAYAFLKQRDFKPAFINITLAKDQDPHNADYWLLSAQAYKGLGEIKEALADLDIAIWLAPQRTELRLIKSMWLYQARDTAASLRETRSILAQEPANQAALFMLYMNLKDTNPAQAKRALQQIVNQDTDSFAQRAAAKLLEK